MNDQEIKKVKKPILRPLTVECFYEWTISGGKCNKSFEVKYNIFRGEHVKRNNWSYWTEKEEDEGKYICNDCLVKLYRSKYTFWETVTNEKKRKIMCAYANNGLRAKKIQCDGTGCDEYSCCLGCKCCVQKSQKVNELLTKLAKKKSIVRSL